jgi:hypothetical protein
MYSSGANYTLPVTIAVQHVQQWGQLHAASDNGWLSSCASRCMQQSCLQLVAAAGVLPYGI